MEWLCLCTARFLDPRPENTVEDFGDQTNAATNTVEQVLVILGIVGIVVGVAGVAVSFLTYSLGKSAGRSETERAVRLSAQMSLRDVIGKARTFFNDWFAPITYDAGWTADKDRIEEAGNWVQAIKSTKEATAPHLETHQKDKLDQIVEKWGGDYLIFAYACRHEYPEKQKETAQELQEWFGEDLQNTIDQELSKE